jgi:hypothetical protein
MSENAKIPYKSLQTALFALCEGLTGGLYDEVPPQASYPYTVLANMVAVPFEARDVQGNTVRVTFHTHSRDAGGKYECYEIMEELSLLLTAGTLTISDWSDVQKTVADTMVNAVPKEEGAYLGILLLDIIMVQT